MEETYTNGQSVKIFREGWTIVIKVKESDRGLRYELEGRRGEMGFSEGNYGNMNEAFSRAMSYIDRLFCREIG